MKQIKLSKLRDAETFFLSNRSKVEYELVERLKGGITSISSTKSGRTYKVKSTRMVYQKDI